MIESVAERWITALPLVSGLIAACRAANRRSGQPGTSRTSCSVAVLPTAELPWLKSLMMSLPEPRLNTNLSSLGPSLKLIITRPAVQRVGSAGDRARGARGVELGLAVAVETIVAVPAGEAVVPAMGGLVHILGVAVEENSGLGDGRKGIVSALGRVIYAKASP